MSIRVLIPGHFLEDLERAFDVSGITWVPYDKEGVPQTDSTGSKALFRWWLSVEQGDKLIRDHPGMRWIHTGSAGVDHILTPTFLQANLLLTNSAGVHAASIAEWVLAAILALEKDLPGMLERQSARAWQKVERDELTGKRIVILGGGQIATEIAVRLRPFGVGLVCVRRIAKKHPHFDETFPVSALRVAVRDADWLILTLPLTPATRGIVSGEVLRLLPARCRVVNVSRGEILDQEALLEALREKRIGGAVLDVFTAEPLPADHPLWSMPNVVVWPHTTGASPAVRRREIELFSENLRRFVAGKPLLNVVDPAAGY